MAVPESLYSSWYSMGRFGLMAIKKSTGDLCFQSLCGIVPDAGSNFPECDALDLAFFMIGGKDWQNKHTNWVFPVVFFTSVISAEQNGLPFTVLMK